MKTIDRRTFIKAATVSTLGLLATPSLGGCGYEPFEGDSININDLAHYELATYEKQGETLVIYVRFVNSFYWFDRSYYALELDDKISEYEIFRLGDFQKEIDVDAEEKFKAYFGITSLEPAKDSVLNVIGIKEQYTTEDLRQALEKKEKELNNTNEKVLTKQTVL